MGDQIPEQQLQFKLVRHGAKVPTRRTPNSAGFDIFAPTDFTVGNNSGLKYSPYMNGRVGNVAVPTGIAVRIPSGYCGRIAIADELSAREHLAVSSGVIGCDNRDEIVVHVFKNLSGWTNFKAGDIFAQLIIEKCSYENGIVVSEFTD